MRGRGGGVELKTQQKHSYERVDGPKSPFKSQVNLNSQLSVPENSEIFAYCSVDLLCGICLFTVQIFHLINVHVHFMCF